MYTMTRFLLTDKRNTVSVVGQNLVNVIEVQGVDYNRDENQEKSLTCTGLNPKRDQNSHCNC
jgi:hypothetical protein